jgi:FkbM family methyltransferase
VSVVIDRLNRTPDGRRIGYGQNGEDVVLLRAFGEQPDGVWIDVGANHPVNDSVTKSFSDMGWSGINVEPVAHLYELLVADRPADINLCVALSNTPGTMTFHRNDSNVDLSSFDDRLVDIYRTRGDVIVDIDVPVMTLTEVCEKYLTALVIDFLKIDLEGHELPVVDGHDFERFPVRVLCAEATAGQRPELVARLSSFGLEQVFFDGLNSWFVRQQELDVLGPVISLPASAVLDWYHPWPYVQHSNHLHERISSLEAELAAVIAECSATNIDQSGGDSSWWRRWRRQSRV